jgi:hypothetical protein
MGMYTTLCLHGDLKENTPDEVLDQLNRFLNGEEKTEEDQRHWAKEYDFYKSFMRESSNGRKDLLVFTETKYASSVEEFLDFICPWIDDGINCSPFIGYKIYEGTNEPQIIIKDDREEFGYRLTEHIPVHND